MSLSHDLLIQASVLAAIDRTRPKQANLRRSVSSAYYALFHFLIEEAVSVLCPSRPLGLAPRFGRAFNHSDMKHVCRSLVEPRPSAVFLELLPLVFSPQTQKVAQAFIDLQNERHGADYDTAISYARTECEALIEQAQQAFAAWDKIRGSDEAAVFLTALLLHKQWNK